MAGLQKNPPVMELLHGRAPKKQKNPLVPVGLLIVVAKVQRKRGSSVGLQSSKALVSRGADVILKPSMERSVRKV